MNGGPVTAREIADLLHELRALPPATDPDPTARAAFLAHKADLLTRIA